jgi:pimeloyl-ACP methyl ester carboxylesterase
MQEIHLTTQLGTVYGQAAGEPGNPVVLGIHGWSQRNGWHSWSPLLEPLAEAGFYAVSVDMPGWGDSSVVTAYGAGEWPRGRAHHPGRPPRQHNHPHGQKLGRGCRY